MLALLMGNALVHLLSPAGPVETTISLQLPAEFVIGSAKASLSILGKNLQNCTLTLQCCCHLAASVAIL